MRDSDRHAEHRQPRLGGGHARQVCGTASARDDHFEAAGDRGLGILEQEVRRAVGGYYLDVMSYAECLERVRRVFHRVPVGTRAHDDADQAVHREILPIRRPSDQRRMYLAKQLTPQAAFAAFIRRMRKLREQPFERRAAGTEFAFEIRERTP